jgi:hypothetical protein
MKHLFSLAFCGLFALFGFIAWFAIQIDPEPYTGPELPKTSDAPLHVSVSDEVATASGNPAIVSGAAIHRELASLSAA